MAGFFREAAPLTRRAATTAVTIAGVAAVVLSVMGRVPWCSCGSAAPWSGDIWSTHNSQHIADPYSFTHVLHGVFFFWALALLLRSRWPDARFALAVGLEAAWEVLENTPMVIQHYRETTISLDYYGDSVANSVADIGACAVGYLIARRLPWWASLAGFFGTELALALTIRDSLIMNVIMLVYPLEAIKQWQMGG